jgi:transposase-like protein
LKKTEVEMTKRKTYTKEFKQQAVDLADANGYKQTGRDLGVHPSQLHRWKKERTDHGEHAFPGQGKPRDEELFRLKHDNARLREELAILKKAVGILSSRPS